MGYWLQIDDLAVPLSASQTYWVGIRPRLIYLGLNSYLYATVGDNAVGSPKGNDGNFYFSRTLPVENFIPAEISAAERGPFDLSLGVLVASVPEPASIVLGLIGLGAIQLRRARGGVNSTQKMPVASGDP